MSDKVKKTIGLIALTLVVAVLIFLVIYFVQKGENDKKQAAQIKNAHIGETLACDGFRMTVSHLDNTLEEIGSIKAQEGNCFLLIEIKIDAEKEITLKLTDFSVDDAKSVSAESQDYEILSEDTTVKAGEESTFYLLYEAEKGRMESFYLKAYGYKIDLGGTPQGPIFSSGDAA